MPDAYIFLHVSGYQAMQLPLVCCACGTLELQFDAFPLVLGLAKSCVAFFMSLSEDVPR